MSHRQCPEEVGTDIVICVDDAVSGVYYSSGIWNAEIRIMFTDTVYGLPHNFNLAFNDTSERYVFLEKVISSGKARKTAFNI